MRMWNVDPRLLCNRHLLGEHVEMHMFVGTYLKGTSMRGYIEGGLVELANIPARHKSLVEEMIKRNMNHQSPLPSMGENVPIVGSVDVAANIKELARRCSTCAGRQV